MRRRTASLQAVIVVDALQVSAHYSGVGWQALSIGSRFEGLPGDLLLKVRCPADLRLVLERAFPAGTRFQTPIRRSRPRLARIAYQQLAAPLRDRPDTLLVCLGDQGPVWGRASVLLVVNDVRRLVGPATSPFFESLFYRLLVPRAVRHATFVVTISEFSRAEIRRVFGEELAVEVVADHPPPKASAPGGHAGGHLLIVGALREYKGIETAIDALALLPKADRPELVLAGPGEGRDGAVRAYAAERGVVVRVLGWVEEALLEELYSSAVATVCPSTYEGYGIAVAESIAHGLPTVASDIPPHREIGSGDAVLYFETGNASSLAGGLTRLNGDAGLCEALARRGLDRSAELAGAGPTWRDVILAAAEQAARTV